MRKKICILVTDAVSFNYLMKGQLEYLSNSEKYEITLISGGDDKQISDLKNRNTGRYIYFPFSREINIRSDIFCLFKLFVFFALNRFDIVIYSTPKALLLGSISSFLTFQKKRIAIVRGRVYENYSGKKRKFFESLDKLSLMISSKSIFISKSLQQKFIEEKIVNVKKSRVLLHGSSNGLDIEWISAPIKQDEISKLKNKINYRECDFVTVCIGRVCVDKGIIELERIFNSLKYFPKFKLILVGRLEDDVAIRIVSRLSKCDNFFHFDQVPDVRCFFNLANLHLFLSHREGFGNVALEAAGFNVPTFGFDVVGIKDSVCDGVSGKLFPFQDTEQISKEVKYYINSKAELKNNYSKGADWAAENFSSTIVWDAYEKEFYK
ncbi:MULTISPECIES: glycosyltransferase [unclassified Pseudoalteromonas]|uniref:glycosyltransferase n=1 Tax=unclassified Pseudoalteromonas TaxID=194690 RepID=UPI00235846D4|nr:MULTISPECIES: glycosyltransferase [unclassified Pseudoalteromonas]MDC9498770.1 glycosyltransferase [Pseudoalteromonas sp. Angola-20]MDC9518583.1 glycosyltransferase [Pseudoalteromonas sp. Angola-22]MDC9534990.1 glycosyltransferase [Pseudoalteromonas sp. Angola-9]